MAKVKKGVLTQGTKVWILHDLESTNPILTRMDCINSIEMGDDSATDIDDTCLDETEVKTSQPGLSTPGEGSIKIHTDPKNASHMALLKAAEAKELVRVYVGWSDGIEEPTLNGADVTLPTTRTWTTFEAILRANSPTFEADNLVNHTIAMKRQTKAVTTYKLS